MHQQHPLFIIPQQSPEWKVSFLLEMKRMAASFTQEPPEAKGLVSDFGDGSIWPPAITSLPTAGLSK